MVRNLNKQGFVIMDEGLRDRQKAYDDFQVLRGHWINGVSLTKRERSGI